MVTYEISLTEKLKKFILSFKKRTLKLIINKAK